MKRFLLVFCLFFVLAGISMCKVSYAYEEEYTDAQKIFLKEVYEHIRDRDTEFVVNYENDQKSWDINDVYYLLSQIDSVETCEDYDYLRGNISRLQCISTYNFFKVKYSFSLSWFENKEQSQWVGEEIARILETNNVDSMNDYEKVLFVHDYIIDNVTYDYNYKNFSAYAGLHDGQTVCQGYSLLTYRMLTQAGVKCRYIVGKYNPMGKGTPENHAWNLVKLGSKWYYLDTTWDDCYYEQTKIHKSRYTYFLKGSNGFTTEHVADEVENGGNIMELYNISTVDYNSTLGSGALAQTGEPDSAKSPYEFFKLKDDGTAVSDNLIIAFFQKIYYFMTKKTLEFIVFVVVVLFIGRAYRIAKNNQ